MFCIAAFIVFAVLALFSARHRPLAAKAWYCVWRRVTFRPCDIAFGDELKARILAKVIVRWPKLVRPIDRSLDWLAFAFVALSIWSLAAVAASGLNLWVYDTCNPSSAESCSLSGEACGVQQASLSLPDALAQNRLGEWAAAPIKGFAETLSRVPDRLKTWSPAEFFGPTATFARAKDAAKPFALEIIDPSCQYCRKLTHNLESAGALESHNVSYLLYPIPLPGGGTKFPHSALMASYIEAAKIVPLSGSGGIGGDWRLLEAIFADAGSGATVSMQERFVLGFTPAQAEAQLQTLLADIGYSPVQVKRIAALASSADVAHALAEQRMIVEEKVRTIKIPTLLIDGRRYDRVVGENTLR
ncbi:MAG TPA: DsbA family protein [Candidatus Peribacteria bacterium]|nr:DsbA family protein [Candidatus Peribacteria bacterium]